MGYGQLINGVHRASLHSTNNTQISDQSEAHSTPQYTHTHAHRTVTQKRKINRQMIKYAIWIWPKTRSIYFHQMLCLCNFICFFSLSLSLSRSCCMYYFNGFTLYICVIVQACDIFFCCLFSIRGIFVFSPCGLFSSSSSSSSSSFFFFSNNKITSKEITNRNRLRNE